MNINEIPSSFKDPSGFVFTSNKRILRQVNLSYKDNYDYLLQSGLYQKLIESHSLIPHKEINFLPPPTKAYKIIAPQVIPFISYPYEWCFSQLKDAALLTLRLQKIALKFGMSLKDASSFNIQFLSGKPIFIDTLSFEKYAEGQPWIAYKQFCEQFLAPLVLAVYVDVRLIKLTQNYIGTIPLDLVVKLLPLTTKIKPSIFLHILLHSQNQQKYASTPLTYKTIKFFNHQALLRIIDSLEETISKLAWKPKKTIWTSYGSKHPSYGDRSFTQKKNLVEKYLRLIQPRVLWDIGANTGVFTRIAAKRNTFTVSLDNDHSAIEQNYALVKQNKEKNILPLWIDLVSPTPAIGWINQERYALLKRPFPDTVLALALIHHLAISHNFPLSLLARFFVKICNFLIIEFIPKEDAQAQILIQNREDVFTNYNQFVFEKEFSRFFTIKEKSTISGSKRILYLMVKKSSYEKV